MASEHASPARRAWQRFRANRLGYTSLILFLLYFGLSLLAEVISNDKPIVARYDGGGLRIL
jgi:microcin C transport system permease protein